MIIMEDSVKGTVISVIKLGGLKVINQVQFPHLITVQYDVNGTTYKKRKYIRASDVCPQHGDFVVVLYQKEKPSKCRIKL
jgi:hypothetical protein